MQGLMSSPSIVRGHECLILPPTLFDLNVCTFVMIGFCILALNRVTNAYVAGQSCPRRCRGLAARCPLRPQTRVATADERGRGVGTRGQA
jgi:hypothetical protein